MVLAKAICLQCSDPSLDDGYATFRALIRLGGCTVRRADAVSPVLGLTQLSNERSAGTKHTKARAKTLLRRVLLLLLLLIGWTGAGRQREEYQSAPSSLSLPLFEEGDEKKRL